MLTYQLKKSPGVPLYEALYRCIREDIRSGKLPAGYKLPSKRALAAHLEVSAITVETAYSQLVAEGYLCAREKVGFFVEAVEIIRPTTPIVAPAEVKSAANYVDLTTNVPANFPFSVWNRLQRQVLLDHGDQLLEPIPHQGVAALRQAIAAHLAAFRGMQVDPENIIIGAGTDFLYNLLLQLLGRERTYVLEEPGYGKIRRIYNTAGAITASAPMDENGIIAQHLGRGQVLHISPSHHFPTGIVTPMPRRLALLNWAANTDSWIIEDDYDTEFRFNTHPISAMYTPDAASRVIYMNSFSKSLAPSIRMGYMVLPPALMEIFREKLGFYSSTVSGFEQHTLARFLREGHFEKHINRMRKFYRARRNHLVELLQRCPWADRLTIQEADAGLHFLVKVDTEMSDPALMDFCRNIGLRVQTLSSYYHDTVPEGAYHTLVINYSGLRDEDMTALEQLLTKTASLS